MSLYPPLSITIHILTILEIYLREGGLNIMQPEDRADDYTRSKLLSDPLAMPDTRNAEVEHMRFMQKIRKDKQSYIKMKKTKLKENIDDNTAYALDLAMEKGASCWLNALPLKKYNFDLSKSGIALRYGWDPVKMPATCACGENFTTSHALHCPKGGYAHMRHNDIRDSIANLLDEICCDVEIEHCLQPLQTKQPVLMTMLDSTSKQMAYGKVDTTLPSLM